MPTPAKYLVVSLPLRIFDSSDHDEALSSLKATISPDNGTVLPFAVPSFKIGTLDALVQQADDLSKLETACAGVVAKVAESLRGILGGDEDKTEQQKMVNDSKIVYLELVRNVISERIYLQSLPTTT
jgi:V-type H+-transporting ATPase subunit C